MTNKEAISILKNAAFLATNTSFQSIEEAVKVAVERLEAPEPCEDAVSRADVVKFLDDWMSALDANCHHQSMADLKIIKNDFENLPSVTPKEQRWIPCSERLPERGEDVLVTRDYDGRKDHSKSCRYVEVASCYGDDDDILWSSYSDEYKMTPKNHHVIAWMPLPEPYGGEQE